MSNGKQKMIAALPSEEENQNVSQTTPDQKQNIFSLEDIINALAPFISNCWDMVSLSMVNKLTYQVLSRNIHWKRLMNIYFPGMTQEGDKALYSATASFREGDSRLCFFTFPKGTNNNSFEQFMSQQFKAENMKVIDDEHLMRQAIVHHPLIFQYLSPRLKNMEEIVRSLTQYPRGSNPDIQNQLKFAGDKFQASEYIKIAHKKIDPSKKEKILKILFMKCELKGIHPNFFNHHKRRIEQFKEEFNKAESLEEIRSYLLKSKHSKALSMASGAFFFSNLELAQELKWADYSLLRETESLDTRESYKPR